MTEKRDGLGDEQGTRIGPPDQSGRVTPAQHTDAPSPRPDRTMGSGSEPTIADRESEQHDHEHRSGYGGKGGKPDTSSDMR
ncbi:hypothetical protein BH11GEM2_BH11GEM2_09350 [soil metagenome]